MCTPGEPATEELDVNQVVLKTLMMSDLVESTRLIEEMGDERTARIFARHDRLARELLRRFDGREIDKTDGFLLLFDRPVFAVRYALAYHQALRELAGEAEIELSARVGIHLGEVVLRRNPTEDVARGAKPIEVEGLAKPTAARLMSIAAERQTLLTRGAFDVARRAEAGTRTTGVELSWLAHGAYLFKGVEEPVEVFEVGVEGFAPLSAPGESDKVRRQDHGGILGWRPAAGQNIDARPNWVLEEKLGEGGFGEVWLARHSKTHDQRVFKFCFDGARLRALQREITLFRLLKEELGDRDDIVRILDWNLENVPYFIESEYTSGGSLIDWAETQDGLGMVPMAVRLEIVAQVAGALAAAHSVGVLHKDVKPGNVLITTDADGNPRAKLTDFGIGLITDRERLARAGITVFGMTVMTAETKSSGSGTRLYMAPELVEGKAATVEADIYALGVMLYQLVTGDLSRALAPGWRRGVDDELLCDDIAAAVDGSPKRRLGNARRLAERLRELESRRAAREAERQERQALELERQEAERAMAALARSRKRRKLVALAITALMFFGAAMAFQAKRIAREAERANREAEAAHQVSGFAEDLLEMLGPSEARGKTVTARQILDQGAQKLEELADQPEIQARLMGVMGGVYRGLGLHARALPLFEDALEARRELYGVAHPKVTDSLSRLAYLLEDMGKNSEAEALYREALTTHRETGNREGVARMLNNLADTSIDRGALEEARRLVDEALAVAREIGDRGGEAEYLDTRVWLLIHQGELAEARRSAYQAAAVWDEIGNRRGAAWADYYLGRIAFSSGDLALAAERYRQAAAVGTEIGNGSLLSFVLAGHSEALLAAGDLVAASEKSEAASEHRSRLGNSVELFETQLPEVRLLLEAQRPIEAEALARQVVAQLDNRGVTIEASARALLVRILITQGQLEDAHRALQPAKARAAESHNPEVRLSVALSEVNLLAANRQYDDALDALDAVDAEAARIGLEGLALEARLDRGKIEVAVGGASLAVGRARLKALVSEAESRGFGLIAQRALARL